MATRKLYGGQMRPWQPCKSVPASTSHTSTSQGWALHTKALAVRHGTNPGRRNNLTTLNMLLPCCKHTSLTGCFCLRLLWQEVHVLISICCTSTIHLHARPQGKHSTHCANRSDPCRKAPAFSVRSDGAYTAAYTLRRSWTWLICKVGARTRLRTHGTFEIPLSRRHPVLFILFWGFTVLNEANKFVYHWKLQKEMSRHQVSNFRKKGSSDKRCLGSMPGHKMPLVAA